MVCNLKKYNSKIMSSEVTDHISVKKDQEYYNGVELGGDILDTIILSGGGYLGLGYIGLFRFLEENGLRDGIRDIYGVSAGALLGLILAIGIPVSDCRRLILDEIDLSKLIHINSRMLLNLPDRLGMNDGQYLIDTCKRMLHNQGLGEYCTFQELYDQRGIDLHFGVLAVFRNEYQIWDRHSRPDMPLWQAIRASCAIPFIFMPVIDYATCDLICDGGMVNNNLIGVYLREKVKNNIRHLEPNQTLPDYNMNKGEIEYNVSKTQRSIGCQAGGENDGNVYLDEPLAYNNKKYHKASSEITSYPKHNPQSSPKSTPKYRQTFWSIDLDRKTYKIPETQKDLESVQIGDFISSIIYKIFLLQDSRRDKFRRLLQIIDCNKYDIGYVNLQLSKDDFDTLEADFYQQAKEYYHSHLLSPNNKA